MTRARHALDRIGSDPLLRSAYSLILNVVLTSGLGVVFWVAAARMFSPSAVGRDSALISAMVAVSIVCGLNLSSAMLRFLPVSKMSPARLILAAYAITGIISALGGVGFVVAAPRIASAYRFVQDDLGLEILWVVSVIAWGVFTLQDAVLTALRRAPWVPVENAAFGIVKFAALPVLLAFGARHAVFIGWTIPMIMLLVPVNYAIFRRFVPTRPIATNELSPVEQLGRPGLARFLANDYLAMIFVQAGSTLLPALVVGLLGSSRGAYFYMPFTIVAAFDTIFFQVFSSVTVEAAMAPARLPELVRTAFRRFGGLLAFGVLALVAGAHLLLLPFGTRYASDGTVVLQLLVCASPFRAVVDAYCAICRVEGRAGPVLVVQACVFAVVTALAMLLGSYDGLSGVGLGWLVGNAAVSLAVAPAVLRVLRSGAVGPLLTRPIRP